jgi:hypothetical protein
MSTLHAWASHSSSRSYSNKRQTLTDKGFPQILGKLFIFLQDSLQHFATKSVYMVGSNKEV